MKVVQEGITDDELKLEMAAAFKSLEQARARLQVMELLAEVTGDMKSDGEQTSVIDRGNEMKEDENMDSRLPESMPGGWPRTGG